MPDPTPATPPPAAPTAAPVKVIDKQGQVFDARPDQVQGAIANGYEVLSPEDVHRHQIQQEERAKGIAGSAEAAAESAGNQLLGGVPGIVAQHIQTAQQNADDQIRQEVHKVARFAGGAAGVAGNFAALGGAAAAAGEAVAGQTIAPAAELATASLGTKLAAQTTNLATQGAVLAAPAALTQAAFGDPKAAAETLGWGFGLGGILGAGTGLLGAAVGKLGARAAEVAEEVAPRGEVPSAEAPSQKQQLLDAFRETQAAPPSPPPAPEADNLEAQLSGTAERLKGGEGLADITAAREPSKSIDYEATKGPLAPGAEAPPAEPAPSPGVEEATSKFHELRKSAYEQLDDYMNPEGSWEGGPSQKVMENRLTPFRLVTALNSLDIPEIKNPLTFEAAEDAKSLLQEAARLPTEEGRVSFDTAQKFLDKLSDRTDPLGQNAYHAIQNQVTAAADKIAAGEPELAKALQMAKVQGETIAQLKQQAAQEAATRAAAEEANLRGGLVDGPPPPIVTPLGGMPQASPLGDLAGSMANQAGRHAAGMAGAAVGHIFGPAGGYVGSLAGRKAFDLLKGMAKMWGRPNSGLAVISPILKRAAEEGPAVFAVVAGAESRSRLDATMTQVHDTMRDLATGGHKATTTQDRSHMAELLGTTSGLSHEQQYAKITDRLATLQSSPSALAQLTGALTSPFVTTAPAVAQAYQAQLARTVAYLHGAVPKPPAPPLPFAPQNWAPTPTDIMAFHDKASIIANPMKLLEHVSRGTLSDAHMDAAQNIYPSLLEKMRGEVASFHAKHPDVLLPLAERISVSKFVGAPLDPTQQPENLLALQASYNQPPSGPPQGPGQGRKAPRALKDKQNHASAFSSTMGPGPSEIA